MKLKMCITGKIFVKICLKAIKDTFFYELRHERKGKSPIFWLGWHLTESEVQNFGHVRMWTLLSPSLCCKSLSPSKIILSGVFGLITVIILKRVMESIFFQNNKFIVCKFRDGKKLAKYLMVFNLYKINHSFQSTKYFSTYPHEKINRGLTDNNRCLTDIFKI